MIKFGVSDSLTIPLALPGAVLTLGSLAIVQLFEPMLIPDAAVALDTWLRGSGTTQASHGTALAAIVGALVLALYLASIFLGTVVAILGGYAEIHILDRFRINRKGVPTEEYWNQWYRYVEKLEERKSDNSYISGAADLLLFQLRCFVACLLLAVLNLTLGLRGGWPSGMLLMQATWLIGGTLSLASAWRYHSELASMRQRRFAGPHTVSEAYESVAKLIAGWCDRQALPPLSRLLPHWPPDESKQKLQQVATALEDVLGLPRHDLYESERTTIKVAKELFQTAANSAK